MAVRAERPVPGQQAHQKRGEEELDAPLNLSVSSVQPFKKLINSDGNVTVRTAQGGPEIKCQFAFFNDHGALAPRRRGAAAGAHAAVRRPRAPLVAASLPVGRLVLAVLPFALRDVLVAVRVGHELPRRATPFAVVNLFDDGAVVVDDLLPRLGQLGDVLHDLPAVGEGLAHGGVPRALHGRPHLVGRAHHELLAGRVFATVHLSCERHVRPHGPLVDGEGVAVQGRVLRSVAHGPVLVAFDILTRVALRPDEALSRKAATLTLNMSLAAYRF